MMYKANFKVNNGTRLMRPLTGTNKKVLCTEIRDYALSELFSGNSGNFKVWHDDADGMPICDIFAEIDYNGNVHYIREAIGSRL